MACADCTQHTVQPQQQLSCVWHCLAGRCSWPVRESHGALSPAASRPALSCPPLLQVAAANGEVIITNDGATILNKMTVAHPAAKMLVELAKSQVSVQAPFRVSVHAPFRVSVLPPPQSLLQAPF